MAKKLLLSSVFLLLTIFQLSCKKLVEVEAPYTSLSSDNVYSTDATAIAVLNGIYSNMSVNAYRFVTGTSSISVYGGLSSDEFSLYGGSANQNALLSRFYLNSLKNTDNEPWNSFFKCLLPTNTAIEKLEASTMLSPGTRSQLIGEAKFIRAFVFFYLTNLYGDVPLAITSDYRINTSLSRSPRSEVYQQIVRDLKDAQNSLRETYLDATLLVSTVERLRPTKWAATALLARVYLYMGGHDADAETQATSLINNTTLFGLSSLNNAFLRAGLNNKEAIWQLQPVNTGWNTEDGRLFILNTAPGTGASNKPIYLTTSLLNSFEANDNRKTSWIKDSVFSGIKYSYPFKYKSASNGQPVNEYLMVLRLAEQYLIRAEARARQSNLQGAISDLDIIRARAALPLIALTNPGINQATLLDAILHERQVELFTEWGHRWLDLKRTGKIDDVMNVVAPQKGGAWSPNWSLYPLPLYDIQQNPNLTQNTGY